MVKNARLLFVGGTQEGSLLWLNVLDYCTALRAERSDAITVIG